MGAHSKDHDAAVPPGAWVPEQPPDEPAPAPAPPIDAKVARAGTAALSVGAVLGIVAAFVLDNPAIVEALPLPPWLIGLVIAVAPAVAAGVAGYIAPHTPRPGDTTSSNPPQTNEGAGDGDG